MAKAYVAFTNVATGLVAGLEIVVGDGDSEEDAIANGKHNIIEDYRLGRHDLTQAEVNGEVAALRAMDYESAWRHNSIAMRTRRNESLLNHGR